MGLFKRHKLRHKPKKLTRAAARALSGGKFWIVAAESDEDALNALEGVTLGAKQVDDEGRVCRARGLVTWCQCTITEAGFRLLDAGFGKRYVWGPDCPDEHAKERAKERQHEIAEFDWKVLRGVVQ